MKYEEINSLTGYFLIAVPPAEDAQLHGSLTYIYSHNANGAMGVVVNRPIAMKLGSLYERLSLPLPPPKIHNHPVYFGGNIQPDRGFVLHKFRNAKKWQSTLKVTEDVALTTSRDILEALGNPDADSDLHIEDSIITLGYSSWHAGQLEQEVTENIWLTLPASTTVLFDTPVHMRFEAAVNQLGFESVQLSNFSGHA